MTNPNNVKLVAERDALRLEIEELTKFHNLLNLRIKTASVVAAGWRAGAAQMPISSQELATYALEDAIAIIKLALETADK